MSDDLTQEAIDAAIILENKIKERIETLVRAVVKNTIREEVNNHIREHKGAMVMEITTSINQMLRGFIEHERKPLWESTPEELGLDPSDLTTHKLGKDIDRAIHKKPPSV